MMMGEYDFDRLRLDRKSFSIHDYDYRYGQYAKPRYVKHPVRRLLTLSLARWSTSCTRS